MKKVLLMALMAILLWSCNSKKPPTNYYQDPLTMDSLKAWKLGIKQSMPREFFDSLGHAIALPSLRAFRLEPLTSPTPVKLSLLQWHDSTDATGKNAGYWIKGINPNYGNRINITLMCDGYLTSDTLKALSDVKNVILAFSKRPPFSWYINRFTFYLIFAHSNQSGIGQIATQCGTLTTVQNYFGSVLGYGGLCRQASCNAVTVNNVLAGTMPYTDVPVVICNTSIYGGAADGNMAVITTDPFSTEVFIHELGHALNGLGDEYAYGGCGFPASWNALSTNDTAYARILWGDTWVNWLPGCGKFSGANYCPSGLRDSLDCEMRTLNQPFCPQCKKRGIVSFNLFTSNIDGFYPILTATKTDGFGVKVLQPVANTIKIVWTVNGVIEQNGGNTFTPSPGTYGAIKVETWDTTKWLFKTQAKHYSQSWANITVSATIPPECASPTSLSATNITQTTVQLNWAGSGTLYDVLLGDKVHETPYTTMAVDGLLPSTTYYYTVTSLCTNGGKSTTQGSFKTLDVVIPPPPTIPAISIGNITQTTFYVNWIKLPNVITYDVAWQKVGQSGWNYANNIPGQIGPNNILMRRVQNLQRNTPYNVKVSAHGLNKWSSILKVTTIK